MPERIVLCLQEAADVAASQQHDLEAEAVWTAAAAHLEAASATENGLVRRFQAWTNKVRARGCSEVLMMHRDSSERSARQIYATYMSIGVCDSSAGSHRRWLVSGAGAGCACISGLVAASDRTATRGTSRFAGECPLLLAVLQLVMGAGGSAPMEVVI